MCVRVPGVWCGVLMDAGTAGGARCRPNAAAKKRAIDGSPEAGFCDRQRDVFPPRPLSALAAM